RPSSAARGSAPRRRSRPGPCALPPPASPRPTRPAAASSDARAAGPTSGPGTCAAGCRRRSPARTGHARAPAPPRRRDLPARWRRSVRSAWREAWAAHGRRQEAQARLDPSGAPVEHPPMTGALYMDAVITPNRSLPRVGFYWLMGGLVLFNLIMAAFFLAIGALPVPVFLGLDVAGVFIAFRLSYASGKLAERVQVSAEEVCVA